MNVDQIAAWVRDHGWMNDGLGPIFPPVVCAELRRIGVSGPFIEQKALPSK